MLLTIILIPALGAAFVMFSSGFFGEFGRITAERLVLPARTAEPGDSHVGSIASLTLHRLRPLTTGVYPIPGVERGPAICRYPTVQFDGRQVFTRGAHLLAIVQHLGAVDASASLTHFGVIVNNFTPLEHVSIPASRPTCFGDPLAVAPTRLVIFVEEHGQVQTAWFPPINYDMLEWEYEGSTRPRDHAELFASDSASFRRVPWSLAKLIDGDNSLDDYIFHRLRPGAGFDSDAFFVDVVPRRAGLYEIAVTAYVVSRGVEERLLSEPIIILYDPALRPPAIPDNP
jgi:hypothetical protein